ncbi:hypothetical protein D3C80_1543390 [compost metagenome]
MLHGIQGCRAALGPIAANDLHRLVIALQPIEAVSKKCLTLFQGGLAALTIADPADSRRVEQQV